MNTFKELNLSEPLIRAIDEMGYTTPSPIQQQALPILLGEPTDFLGLAATGTGKTAAFSIPLLEKIDPSVRAVQGLILCPTRELALQVAGQINLLGKYLGISAQSIYGGASYSDQIRGLKMGATIVVGTPGRVIDHIDRGTLKLQNVSTVILDEADEMISMGFKEDLEKILDATPRETSQIWLFSATMGGDVRGVADAYLRKPQKVQVNQKEMLSTTVEQLYFPVRESDKPEILCKLIEAAEEFYGIVFCQTKALVADLSLYLTDRGYKVDSLHGDKDQNSREKTMRAFRERKVRILICTDVAARGLDVKDVSHVINYSIPRELDNYVHRIGRTARSGKSGIAISLVTPSQRMLIGRIEKMTKSRMKEGLLPTRKDIGIKKSARVLLQFRTQKHHERAIETMGLEWAEAITSMSQEEIVGRFLAMLSPDLFNERDPQKARPAPIRREREDGAERSGGGDRGGGRRFDRGGPPRRGGFSRGGSSGDRRDDRGPRRDFSRGGDENRRPRFDDRKNEDRGSKAPWERERKTEDRPAPARGGAPAARSEERGERRGFSSRSGGGGRDRDRDAGGSEKETRRPAKRFSHYRADR